MPDALVFRGNEGCAVVFMGSAALVYAIIAAACSSPQTAEINAKKRSETLMRWVHIGLLQSALFVLIAASLTSNDKEMKAALYGGMLAGSIMYASYRYADHRGTRSMAPGTED